MSPDPVTGITHNTQKETIMNAKTPYEIRLEVLKMAQEQANARFYNQWDQASRKADINENAQFLTEVPEFPTAEQILQEANKLKAFVDKG